MVVGLRDSESPHYYSTLFIAQHVARSMLHMAITKNTDYLKLPTLFRLRSGRADIALKRLLSPGSPPNSGAGDASLNLSLAITASVIADRYCTQVEM